MYFLPCFASCFSILLVYVSIRSSPFLPSFQMFFFLRFHGSLKGCLINALLGLLTLRLPSLGWFFLASSLCLRFSFLPWTFISGLLACYRSRACSLFMFYHAVLLVFPKRPPCPALSKYQQSSCFSILWVYEYFCSTPSPSVLENWVFSSLSFNWDPVLSFGSVCVL